MQDDYETQQVETHPAKSLAVRGGLFRTFGSLAGFLALLLLTLGVYLIEDTFSNPLTAQPASVLAGGFVLGLDAVLIYFLIKPRKRTRIARVHHRHQASPVPPSHARIRP